MELKLDRLTKQFGSAIAVDRLSATLTPGVYGLLGANGAGKTTLMRMICDVLKPTSGSVVWNGVPIERLGERYRSVLGYLPQDFGYYPDFTALDFMLYLSALKGLDSKAAKRRSMELLDLVGLAGVAKRKVKTFSGGMKQRVVIAIALVCNPALLIADEPTTALDVTIQAQILTMICNLQRKYGTSVIMITHDLGVVAETCDKVAIMYAGEAVEYGTLADIFTGENHHPYTVGLFGSIPSLTEESKRLHPIEGLMPDPTEKPAGCWFAPRCRHCTEKCKKQVPPVYEKNGHQIRCHLFGGEERKVR